MLIKVHGLYEERLELLLNTEQPVPKLEIYINPSHIVCVGEAKVKGADWVSSMIMLDILSDGLYGNDHLEPRAYYVEESAREINEKIYLAEE